MVLVLRGLGHILVGSVLVRFCSLVSCFHNICAFQTDAVKTNDITLFIMTICYFPLGLVLVSLGLVTGANRRLAAPLKGAWEDCSRSSECKNQCCSKESSATHKCTPGGTVFAGSAEDWLDAINSVRETYQVDSLAWSNDLKSEAQVWANNIAKSCVNGVPGAGQNPNDYGISTIINMRNPKMAVERWVANGVCKHILEFLKAMSIFDKIAVSIIIICILTGVNAETIPSKASNIFTQMIWAGSEYVGCADATSSQSGKTCTGEFNYFMQWNVNHIYL